MENEIIYNPIARVLVVNNEITQLTNIENKLMNVLVKNLGKITAKEDVWEVLGYDKKTFDSSANTYINTNICRLRKKINKYFDILISTGIGYMLIKKGHFIKDENCIII